MFRVYFPRGEDWEKTHNTFTHVISIYTLVYANLLW